MKKSAVLCLALALSVSLMVTPPSSAEPAVASSGLHYLVAQIPNYGLSYLQCEAIWTGSGPYRDNFYGYTATNASGEIIDSGIGLQHPHEEPEHARVSNGPTDVYMEGPWDGADYEDAMWRGGLIGSSTYGGTTFRVVFAVWSGANNGCYLRFPDGTKTYSRSMPAENARSVRAADFTPSLGIETRAGSIVAQGVYEVDAVGYAFVDLSMNGRRKCLSPEGEVYGDDLREGCRVTSPSNGTWRFEIDAGQRFTGGLLYFVTVPLTLD